MNYLIILAMLLFPLAFGEYLTNTELLVPWACNICYSDYDDNVRDRETEAQYLRRLTQEGIFEHLRKNFYPQMEATLKVSDDQHIRLAIKKADMDDVVVYCNLCRVYAELIKPKEEPSYLQQLGVEQKNIFLKQLKATLNEIRHLPLVAAEKADVLQSAEKSPFVVVHRGCEVYLFVPDTWRIYSNGRCDQLYRCFKVPHPPHPQEEQQKQYQIYHKKMRPELTFPQFLFERRLLAPSWQEECFTYTFGCKYEIQRYSLEEILIMRW